MIVINMPGGAVQYIEEGDLLWLRKAFDSEWKGAVMLRLVTDRIYSSESVKGALQEICQRSGRYRSVYCA